MPCHWHDADAGHGRTPPFIMFRGSATKTTAKNWPPWTWKNVHKYKPIHTDFGGAKAIFQYAAQSRWQPKLQNSCLPICNGFQCLMVFEHVRHILFVLAIFAHRFGHMRNSTVKSHVAERIEMEPLAHHRALGKKPREKKKTADSWWCGKNPCHLHVQYMSGIAKATHIEMKMDFSKRSWLWLIGRSHSSACMCNVACRPLYLWISLNCHVTWIASVSR